ncbi:MAG: aconitase/3-isopropylmalate dehydratase large subunit family protein [Anaerolineae bacterium]|jgi:3-isopropylmalate/(R)-2-methylmalate dehydratase large subunit|nr:aconitase/3-isopropylmalate dehydratase large subunit family protein [Anaerolineae bacterium]MDX9833103.1 aconitase/3-isopropylmalate dehydratase large subunit family protein [Anaerolineae bacterium]
MSQTIIEKIIQAHSDEPVEAGKIVWMRLDARTARDFGGANVVKNYRKHYGSAPVDDPARTFFTFDLVTPANNIPYAVNQQICRDWAREQGVKVYDVDQGIGSHVAIESGLAWPGSTFVGTDSHLNILGAIGSFGQGMGDQDIAFTFKAGKTWFEVPASMKVTVKGELKRPCTAKDLTLAVLRVLGASGALGQAVEFYGPAVEALDLAGRITLASMMTEMGGIVGLIPPSEEVLAYCRERTGRNEFQAIAADPGAQYTAEIEVDITGLEPLVACPPKPDNVKPVREVAGTRIDSVFIGSCTNGRLEDMRAVAEVVKGKRVAPGMVASVVPATRQVYAQMLQDGTLQTLFDAGFIISNPGCGGCASGHIGMVGEGQVQVSTSNRNFAGKQGPGDNYLASPTVAAWAALAGELTVLEG